VKLNINAVAPTVDARACRPEFTDCALSTNDFNSQYSPDGRCVRFRWLPQTAVTSSVLDQRITLREKIGGTVARSWVTTVANTAVSTLYCIPAGDAAFTTGCTVDAVFLITDVHGNTGTVTTNGMVVDLTLPQRKSTLLPLFLSLFFASSLCLHLSITSLRFCRSLALALSIGLTPGS
jgi:hypothetical protein